MALLQLLPGSGRVRRRPDQSNDRVELVEGEQQAQKNMVPLLGLAQQVTRAAFNGLYAELEENLEHPAQGQQDRLTIHQCQHVGTEIALQRSEFEQVVQHNLWVSISPQLDHDSHPVAIALISNVGYSLKFLVVDHFRDSLDQSSLIGLIRQFGDDHRIAIRAACCLDRLDCSHATHGHRTTAAQIRFPDAFTAKDLPSGGEVRAGDQSDQFLFSDVRVGNQGQQSIDQFIEVVGRNIGRHPHSDPGGAVEQKLWNPCRQNGWLLLRAIKIVCEINRLRLDILQQAVRRERLQTRFGVPHSGRRIVVHRTEIAVPINQRHRHREVLGHTDQGVVNRCISVGMIFAENFAHHAGALSIRTIAGQSQLVHGIENSPMHRLEAVAGIGEGPTHDHTHRILQIGARHLVTEIRLDDSIVGIAGAASSRPH